MLAARQPPKGFGDDQDALTEAQAAYSAALAPLSKQEIEQLQTYLVPVLSTQNQVGHTLADRSTGRLLCDLMEKMDRSSLYAAADALAPIADARFLEQLKKLPADGNVRVPGVTGRVVARIETPGGAIIVGGKGPNTYELDKMRDVAAVIDLGGGDTFYEGTVGTDRPILLVIDLGGNNAFRGTKPGIQGGAVLGVSMLLVPGGNNTYEAQDVAQGSALAGVGIQVDYGSQQPLSRIAASAGPGPRRFRRSHGPRRSQRLSRRTLGPGHGPPAGLRTLGQRQGQQPLLLRRDVAQFYIPRRPAMRAGDRASAPASGKSPAAASA